MNLEPDVPDDGRLGLAVTLAREAGRHVIAWRAESAVAWKAPGERVTDADVRAQAEMITAIRARFPADGIVAEEGEPSTGGDELAAAACCVALDAPLALDRTSLSSRIEE